MVNSTYGLQLDMKVMNATAIGHEGSDIEILGMRIEILKLPGLLFNHE